MLQSKNYNGNISPKSLTGTMNKVVRTGGGTGTGDHRDLSNRDAPDQHPISAITGLEDALASKTNGYTFTPSVSPEGVISWSNNGNLPNPDPVNIKGPQGEPGAQGEQGPMGPEGPQGPAGQDGAQGPAGEQGPEGPAGKDGVTPIISVTATTLEPGSEATVSKSGSDESPTFTFGIPKGATGEQGPKGDTGPQGETGPEGPQGPKGDTGEQGQTGPAGENGADGADGKSATITIYETITGEPGSNASVVNTGDELNAVLSFTIPRGAQGETGLQGPPGQDGSPGSDGYTPQKGIDYWTSQDQQDIKTSLEQWIQSHGYLTSSALNGYATTAYVDDKIGAIDTLLDTINGEVV